MKYLTRMLALTRFLLLRKQWKDIRGVLNLLTRDQENVLGAMVYGELQRAAKHPVPRFYASQQMEAYSPWGDALTAAWDKICSDEPQVQLRGLAVWLAVAFHETHNAALPMLSRLNSEISDSVARYRQLHERLLAIRAAA
ncbi:hypothetical protein [Pseudomarimonas arenosa]|uniref:Uncharacterized protein n=1 Tax=Pseudomarimonas arenosa TaxID=2774145 RepID=A0AAW3ZPQ3_9GAMM|nr:hypothetical protein [Pseudomarimonas arenosa]MBD8527154.1 hypothetical protein [Pseudomarimonas arenosa]